MKNFLIIASAAAMLAACTHTYVQSPAVSMSPKQIRTLSNTQLCELSSNYPWEAQTETEIGRRNLNCDPAYNECRAQGNKDNTPALNNCINQIHANSELHQQVEKQQQELKRQNAQIERDRSWDALTQSITNRQNAAKNRQIIKTPDGTIVQEW